MKPILVIFIIIKINDCLKVQKTPKHSTKIFNNDAWSLTHKPDKQSFPNVIYPTSILDVTKPFFFNTDNSFEVMDPFSVNVKSSNGLFPSIAKLASNVCKPIQTKNQSTANDIGPSVLKTDINAEGKTDDSYDDDKENATIILIESNKCHNYTDFNISLEDIENVTGVPIYVKIKMEVFKNNAYEKKNYTENVGNSSHEMDEKAVEVNRYQESYESSEEEEYNSKENSTEFDNEVLSICSIDFSENSDNMTEVLNTTLIESVLEKIDSSEKCNTSECLNDDVESTLQSLIANISQTDLIDNYDQCTGSKEDYFLDFVISLDALCEINNTKANTTNVESSFLIEQEN